MFARYDSVMNIVMNIVSIGCAVALGVAMLFVAYKTHERREQRSEFVERHTCTKEQKVEVERDTLFCQEKGGYIQSYCYDRAIMQNCTAPSK